MKPMQDFQCVCLLISHLHFETFNNHCEDAVMSEQKRLMSLKAKEHTQRSYLENHLMSIHYLCSLFISIEGDRRNSVSAGGDLWKKRKCKAVAKTADNFLSVSIICLSSPNVNNSLFNKSL